MFRTSLTGATAPALRGAAELDGQHLGLLLGRDLDRRIAGRPGRPPLDLDVAHQRAGSTLALGARSPDHPLRLKRGEVAPEPPIHQRAQRRVGAEIAIEALEQIDVVEHRRALQPTLGVTLDDPSVDRVLQGVLLV